MASPRELMPVIISPDAAIRLSPRRARRFHFSVEPASRAMTRLLHSALHAQQRQGRRQTSAGRVERLGRECRRVAGAYGDAYASPAPHQPASSSRLASPNADFRADFATEARLMAKGGVEGTCRRLRYRLLAPRGLAALGWARLDGAISRRRAMLFSRPLIGRARRLVTRCENTPASAPTPPTRWLADAVCPAASSPACRRVAEYASGRRR